MPDRTRLRDPYPSAPDATEGVCLTLLRRNTILCVSISLCCAAWIALFIGTPSQCAAAEDQFLGVDALKRGDVGYMLTVLADTDIQRLEIEILSVERGTSAKGDIIWARGTDATFAHLGVASGMSGSPVYVGERLIGACAYTYSFAKDAILGITPISQMLEIWDRNMTPTPRTRRRANPAKAFQPFPSAEEWAYARTNPHGLAGSATDPVVTDDVVRHNPELDAARGMTLKRIATPLMFGGFGPAAQGIVDSLFADRGFLMVPTAATGSGHAMADTSVKPGSTVGIEFVKGDLSAFGYGTATYRDGNRVLAFGHPMLGEGDTHLPLSAGMIHFVLANDNLSFKIGSATEVVGTLVQDRNSGIAGIIQDDHPSYLPMTVTVRSHEHPDGRTFHYDLLRHHQFTGGLAMAVASVTMASAEKTAGDYAITATTTVTFDDAVAHAPLVKRNVLSGTTSPTSAAATMLAPISTIVDNWYEEIGITNIHLDLEYRDGFDVGVMETARLDRERVRPGGTVKLMVTYRPYLDDPMTHTYDIHIPQDAEEGQALVFVGDSAAHEAWEQARAPERYQPSTAARLLDLLERGGTQREVWISVVAPKMGVAIKGAELPKLPLSVLSVMTPTTQDGNGQPTRGSVLIESKHTTPFVLHGSTLLPINIDPSAPQR